MQALSWYIARLSAMTPREIAWRMRTSLRTRVDYVAGPLRRRARPLQAFLDDSGSGLEPAFRVCDTDRGAWNGTHASHAERQWARQLAKRAAAIADSRLSYFDQADITLGQPIDWNKDHKHTRSAPMRFAPAIDYRDFDVTGDCKLVWEPNRHHQFVVLGRAYRATGDERFAQAAVKQLNSWLDQCPFGVGMNWRSPLELGIRLINWVWTYDLIRDSEALDEHTRSIWLRSFYQHMWEIARNYSCGSSVGNHLIGEAAGVFIAASYLPFLKHARKWQRQSRATLEQQMLGQTFPDGGSREIAFGYHLFVLQFFTLAALVGRWTGEEFSEDYWQRLRSLFGFVEALQAGGESPPAFGDGDDGYVLDLGDGPPDATTMIAIGSALFGGEGAERDPEPIRWLMRGQEGLRSTLDTPSETHILRSRAFPDSGFYLLQCGATPAERISIVFDCGPLGLAPMAGHGHADALSITLRAFGKDILVDPGTYDYYTHPAWRRYFRSTAAHNTIEIDSENQSLMQGSFLWAQHAKARCLDWTPTAFGGAVVGEHDGYTRLAQPVMHRRRVELDGTKRELVIRDELFGTGRHEAALRFQLSEFCQIEAQTGNQYAIEVDGGQVAIELDPRLKVRARYGSEAPIGGWVSRGYHHKIAATQLVGRIHFENETTLISRIRIGEPR